jgi:hypothetical protein
LGREKFKDDFGEFDTFSACIVVDGIHDNVVDHRKLDRSAMNRLCIKGRKSIWDGVLQQDLGLGISRNLFIESPFCKDKYGTEDDLPG